MLSNTSSGIARRRQLHRRQNSTPTAFEAPNVRPLPANIHAQRNPGHGHRRGMSLDQRPTFHGQYPEHMDFQRQGPGPFSQDDMSVSIGTNTGQFDPQHPMQVAQQHRPSQPGQEQQQPQAAQHTSQFQSIQPHPQTPHGHRSLEPLALPPSGVHQGPPQLSPTLQLSPTAGLPQPPGPQSQPSPGPPSDQQLKDLEQHIKSVYGAYGTVYVNILPSPVAAPQKMSADNLDISPMPGNLNEMTEISLDPPGTGFNMSSQPGSERGYDPSSCYSPGGFSPGRSPSPSPAQRHVQAFLENVEEIPVQAQVPHLAFSDSAPLLSSPLMKEHSNSSFFSSSPVHSPSRSPRAISIADLDLDASIEDTGISAEEVSSYISVQDPVTHRWTCLFPECNKTFGRRENIRSHVQTHLGDRQFRCNACGKCFVRQHDLKRHSKIHTGDKPYRCPCGGGFARQDALTRHRQRGMCVGGFPGAVRSGKARGRPRKKRPDLDDRMDKAQRTRRAAATKRNYAGSISEETESDDSGMSPMQDFNNFDSAPLPDLGSDPTSDPFSLDNTSSPLGSTSPAGHQSFDSATSPFEMDTEPKQKQTSAGASPFAFDGTKDAADESGFDFERAKADADALFNFSGTGERFAQTPPHSPTVKIPGSGGSKSEDLPQSPSHRSANSAVSNAFTTPPTSPVCDTKETVEVTTSSFEDFSASTMSTSGFEMSGLTASTMDMSMFQEEMLNAPEYSSDDVMNASIAWIDAHF